MAKQIQKPAARIIQASEHDDDAIIRSSIKFKKGRRNKPVLVITVGLKNSKIVDDIMDNPEDAINYREAELAKDFFPPGQFNISFEKRGEASTLMKIDATLPTKVPGTGGVATKKNKK